MTYSNKKPVPVDRDGPSVSVLLGGERSGYSLPKAFSQRRHEVASHDGSASEALVSARRAHAEALALGGRHGANLDALAVRFARRARSLIIAGGAA